MIIKELSTEHPRSSWYIEKRWQAIVEVLKASKQALQSVPTDNTSLMIMRITKCTVRHQSFTALFMTLICGFASLQNTVIRKK